VFARILGKESGEGKISPCADERGGPPADAGALLADRVTDRETCWGPSLIYQQGW